MHLNIFVETDVTNLIKNVFICTGASHVNVLPPLLDSFYYSSEWDASAPDPALVNTASLSLSLEEISI